MDLTSIIIVITFFAALAEKFSDKPISERKGIFKKLKLENIAILLLGLLLFVQLFENINKSRKEASQETKSKETHENILNTKEKIDEANKLIDSILLSLKQEIEFTREEFRLISSLNQEMADARKNISTSILEYQKLNSKYSAQLELEREKIINAKPDVRIMFPKSTKDSISFNYQFQLVNFGQRIADSVVFQSIMTLIDVTNLRIAGLTELKTNSFVHNITSLPPNQGNSYIANSRIAFNKDIGKYGSGYLLIKIKFFDLMTNSTIEPPVSIYWCFPINEINIQYGSNVDAAIVSKIKTYFQIEKPELYSTFFKE